MNVSDVFVFAKQFNATIISGEKGLQREISSIEVMEVPGVQYWVKEGVLVISTFHSVENDPKEQYRIINVLIEKQAAGIIIKSGRFTKNVSKEVIQLAKQHDFPVIILPEDVPYIHLLNPIYTQVYGNDTNKSVLNNFGKKTHHSVEAALEDLSEMTKCSVYIEDKDGRLLYQTRKMYRDGWRQSTLLFSLPSYNSYKDVLNDWQSQLRSKTYIFVQLPGKKQRIIMPLTAKGKTFAFIHFVFNLNEEVYQFNEQFIEQIINKIYITMMGEIIELQQHRFMEEELLNQFIMEQDNQTSNIILYFKQNENQVQIQQTFPIDYQCLYRKSIYDLMKWLPSIEQFLVFERDMKTYVLLRLSERNDMRIATLKNELVQLIESTPISDNYISISSIFNEFEHIDQKIQAVTRIMDIGEEVYPEEQVHDYNTLGVYEFFIKLSSDKDLQQYVHGILRPIDEGDKHLFETLKIYLQENGNTSRTSERLFVNRRTINYRLQKIKELLGMDLDCAESRFILQFCFKMKELE